MAPTPGEHEHRTTAANVAAALTALRNDDLLGIGHLLTNMDRWELEMFSSLTLTHLYNTFLEEPAGVLTEYINILTSIGDGETRWY